MKALKGKNARRRLVISFLVAGVTLVSRCQIDEHQNIGDCRCSCCRGAFHVEICMATRAG